MDYSLNITPKELNYHLLQEQILSLGLPGVYGISWSTDEDTISVVAVIEAHDANQLSDHEKEEDDKRLTLADLLTTAQNEIDWLDDTIPLIDTADISQLRIALKRSLQQNRKMIKVLMFLVRFR
jgi:hypothetical protein